ncbi:MAG: hypothetical protein AB1478_00065 [Nitrospirota bacterium]
MKSQKSSAPLPPFTKGGGGGITYFIVLIVFTLCLMPYAFAQTEEPSSAPVESPEQETNINVKDNLLIRPGQTPAPRSRVESSTPKPLPPPPTVDDDDDNDDE